MFTSEYLATVSYKHHEQELVRDLERRRVSAERRQTACSHPVQRSGLRVTVGAWIGRLHSGRDQHAVRS